MVYSIYGQNFKFKMAEIQRKMMEWNFLVIFKYAHCVLNVNAAV